MRPGAGSMWTTGDNLRHWCAHAGEHGVGGRLATRCSLDGSLKGAPAGLLFDHAAQFFTATDPAFTSMVHRWEADGAVMRWTGPVGMLAEGHFVPDDGQGAVRWVARGGMRQLAQYLAGQAHRQGEAARGPSSPGSGTAAAALVTVRRPQWISSAQAEPKGWRLVGRGRDQGLFDVAVIAHNGKCANRLAAPMRGAEAVHRQLRRLKLSANWVLMAAFASPVAAPGGLQGAFVSGSQVLGWAANNTAKLGGPAQGGVQCWTLISTQAYGRLNKVPQENVPPEVAQRVTAEMLAAFTRCLGLPEGALPPLVFTQAQLWGAALPTNSPHVPCLFDPSARVGVCGDWVAGGGSMQAAALSGVAMAQRIVAASGQQGDALRGLALGLDVPLRAVQGEQIGQFPGKQAAPAADAHTSVAAQTAAPAGKQPSLGAY
ncbi:Renalase [Chlorella vulgaris]